jgi:cytochrome b561
MTKNAPARYHPSQVTFHWLTVILLFAMFPLGTYMSRLPNDAGKIALLTVHTILGSIILIIIIARFINRFRLPRPAHATAGNVFLDWIGKVVHYLLYMLVFLMVVSGISLSLQAGLLPIIFGRSGAALPADFYVFVTRMLHGVIAPMLALLIVLHVGAALYHQFVLKDNLLSRMWYKKKTGDQ